MIELSLAIDGVDPQQLTPFSVDGTEELSTLFVFDVLCLSSTTHLPLKPDALGRSATLTISPEGTAQRKVQGIVESFSIVPAAVQEQVVYRVRIVPALAQLRLSRHNRIYGTVEQINVADILQSMLQGTLQRGSQADNPSAPNLQYDLRLRQTYPKFHHVTQYEETDFAFLSRLTEHWGIYFFFENQNGVEQVVFADDPVFAPLLSDPSQLACVPPWSASGPAQPNVVQRFDARYQQVSHRLFLQDYNERLPQVPLLVSAEIDPHGSGYVVKYGDHYRTPSEGEFLARIRAEELYCMKSRFSGASTAAALAPGYCFDLTDCDLADWNERYLVISVKHRAHVSLHGVSGLTALGGLHGNNLDAGAAGTYGYSNDFTAMVLSDDAPFRPALRTPVPRIDGLLNGRIETSLDNNRPHLNEDGWYRVRLPFDLGGTPGGQASRWIRMAEPYGGPSNGMHFPLPPDTDVVIACVNGDPDRPVIVGAVPSANTPSVVNSNTSHLNRIQTRSGIVFTMADFTK